MIDMLAELVVHYGLWLIFTATLLSCLAVPVPVSLVMLSAGAFSAGDDLNLWACAGAGLAGATLGDQLGFRLGRHFDATLERASGKSGRMIEKARTLTKRHGGPGVFLSRWLFSPLGPYVTYVAGATGMAWRRFTLWAVPGATVWVTIYVGAGHAFADQLETVASVLTNASGAAAGLVVSVALGVWLWRQAAPKHRKRR